MSRTVRTLRLALGATVLLVPALISAQPRHGASRERPGAITHLLNARRQLDLTPRQIIQLDSLERIQHAERKQFNERMRGARDSMMTRARTGARTGARTPAARDSMQMQARARMEAERPQIEQRRRRDSSMSAAAERVLNDTQRQKVREMSAERRGYERGMRESRAPRGANRGDMRPQQGRPQGGPPDGMRGPQRPAGPGGVGGMGPRRPPVEQPDDR